MGLTAVQVNPGLLYPLRSGLAFVEKPPLFLPAASWDGASLGRAGGPGASFDLTVSNTEFTLLPRDDMDAVRAYIAARCAILTPAGAICGSCGRCRTRALAKRAAEAAAAVPAADAESDSEEDEDFAAAAGDGESDGSGGSSSSDEEGGSGSGSDSDSEPAAGGWGVRPAQPEAPPPKKARLEEAE